MNDRQRLEAIVAVVCRYLPPDGISREEAMSQIIELVDPLPEQEQWDASDMAHRSGGLSVEQAEKQEPVCDKDPHLCWSVRCQLGKVCKNTAPPRKEWIGLTDDEVHKIIDDCTSDEAELEELNDFAKAIFAVEAKLKERNK